MNPKVSIILTTYNRSQLLNRSIKSVLNQSFGDWELIVINDFSADNTQDVLDNWQKQDLRIKVINNSENSAASNGIYKNLNKGIEISRGKYIARLDDDDEWADKDKLKKQVYFLENNQEYVICGGGVIVTDDNNKELFRYFKNINDSEIRRRALFANPFSHSTVMFLKEAAKKVGYYSPLRYAEDWDLWLKLGGIGKFYNFPEYFAIYRMTLKNESFIHQRLQSKTILGIINKYKNNYPNFYFAYCLNFAQYLYSCLPNFVKKIFHQALSGFKRSI